MRLLCCCCSGDSRCSADDIILLQKEPLCCDCSSRGKHKCKYVFQTAALGRMRGVSVCTAGNACTRHSFTDVFVSSQKKRFQMIPDLCPNSHLYKNIFAALHVCIWKQKTRQINKQCTEIRATLPTVWICAKTHFSGNVPHACAQACISLTRKCTGKENACK